MVQQNPQSGYNISAGAQPQQPQRPTALGTAPNLNMAAPKSGYTYGGGLQPPATPNLNPAAPMSGYNISAGGVQPPSTPNINVAPAAPATTPPAGFNLQQVQQQVGAAYGSDPNYAGYSGIAPPPNLGPGTPGTGGTTNYADGGWLDSNGGYHPNPMAGQPDTMSAAQRQQNQSSLSLANAQSGAMNGQGVPVNATNNGNGTYSLPGQTTQTPIPGSAGPLGGNLPALGSPALDPIVRGVGAPSGTGAFSPSNGGPQTASTTTAASGGVLGSALATPQGPTQSASQNYANLQTTVPGQDLTTQTILPGQGLDRTKLAQQQLSTLDQQLQPYFNRDVRSAADNAAAGGQTNSGMLRSSLGDLANQYALERQGAGQNYMQNAQQGSVEDMYRNLGILQQQQGFQANQQNTAFNQGLASENAGYANDPAQYDMLLSQLYGNNAAAAGQGVSGLIQNSMLNSAMQNNPLWQMILQQQGGGNGNGGGLSPVTPGSIPQNIDWSTLLNQYGGFNG